MQKIFNDTSYILNSGMLTYFSPTHTVKRYISYKNVNSQWVSAWVWVSESNVPSNEPD